MDKTSLGDRMKEYERAYDISLTSRLPVIIRLDGKCFSKWTKKAELIKPFDGRLVNLMAEATVKTAEQIEGCRFGYTQSDEITFVLRNDQSLESTPWFGNRLQKICSVASSMVTHFFNKGCYFADNPAFFDARAFLVPNIEEAINCLIWRQNDCTKNSISCATYYEIAKKRGRRTARKLIHGLNQNQQQELLFSETGINWNDYPTSFKRGIGCYRETFVKIVDEEEITRSAWQVEEELSIFTRNRNFLYSVFSNKEKEND
jgi:tRNA(His) 5'-end guanylyltransferase